MQNFAKVQNCAKTLQGLIKSGIKMPRYGLVLGTGLGGVADLVEEPCRIPFADLPGLQSPVVTDNDIFIVSGLNIFRFGRDGKFRNRIGHNGRGPGEFLSATAMFRWRKKIGLAR